MATIASTGKRRNFRESLWRVANQAWFGQSATGVDQIPDALNGEYLLGVNNAGTGTVNLIGATAGDLTSLPNGFTIPTGKVATVTDADGLTVGGIIVPQKMYQSYCFDAATAVTRTGFIALAAFQVVGVSISWGVASASGTFAIEKLTGTAAPGAGTTMLTGTLSTAGTANTVTAGTLVALAATLQLAAGDRIGFVFTGTETGLVGLNVTLAMKRI